MSEDKLQTSVVRYLKLKHPKVKYCSSIAGAYISSAAQRRKIVRNGYVRGKNDLDIYEDGLESRDFVYIDDAVDATILGIEKDKANGHVFNVGSGVATTVKEVAESLKKSYNSDINISISRKFRFGDIRHNVADLKKVKDVLGFVPKYNFQKGILKFVAWAKTQNINFWVPAALGLKILTGRIFKISKNHWTIP